GVGGSERADEEIRLRAGRHHARGIQEAPRGGGKALGEGRGRRGPAREVDPASGMRIALTTLLLCVALGAARAETVEVTGVAFNDVLNLRSEPRAGAPLAGALPPAAVGIEALKRADGWVYVRSGRLEGWAAARYLRPQSVFGERPPSPLRCIGTEPFWSFTLAGNALTYTTPELKPVTAQIGTVQQSLNSTIVWRVTPKDGPVASA